MSEPSTISRLREFSARDGVFRRSVCGLLFAAQNAVGGALYRRPPPRGSTLLNLGSGLSCYPGWINANCYDLHGYATGLETWPEWLLDAGRPWRCPDDHWSGIFTEHMLEHLSYAQAVTALSEAFRTLRPGAWLRVVLPDIGRACLVYFGTATPPSHAAAMSGPEFISHLTQHWGHRSVWDTALLSRVLLELGFVEVSPSAFGESREPQLLKDDPRRREESFYLEARKPL